MQTKNPRHTLASAVLTGLVAIGSVAPAFAAEVPRNLSTEEPGISRAYALSAMKMDLSYSGDMYSNKNDWSWRKDVQELQLSGISDSLTPMKFILPGGSQVRTMKQVFPPSSCAGVPANPFTNDIPQTETSNGEDEDYGISLQDEDEYGIGLMDEDEYGISLLSVSARAGSGPAYNNRIDGIEARGSLYFTEQGAVRMNTLIVNGDMGVANTGVDVSSPVEVKGNLVLKDGLYSSRGSITAPEIRVQGSFSMDERTDVNAIVYENYGSSKVTVHVLGNASGSVKLGVHGDVEYLPGMGSEKLANSNITVNIKDGSEKKADQIAQELGLTGSKAVTINGEQKFVVAVSAVPGVTVSGNGCYAAGETVTLAASHDTMAFEGWVENGHTVSTEATYTFQADAHRNLEAVFTDQYQAVVSYHENNGKDKSQTIQHLASTDPVAAEVAEFGFSGASQTVNGEVIFTGPERVFVGWNTQPDGSGQTIQPGESLNGVLDLYAMWATDMSTATVTMEETELFYTGSELKPGVNVVFQGKTLKEGKDFRIEYEGNIGERQDFPYRVSTVDSTGTARVVGIGEYCGSASAEFHIQLSPADKERARVMFYVRGMHSLEDWKNAEAQDKLMTRDHAKTALSIIQKAVDNGLVKDMYEFLASTAFPELADQMVALNTYMFYISLKG